jgi:hypothetical protein
VIIGSLNSLPNLQGLSTNGGSHAAGRLEIKKVKGVKSGPPYFFHVFSNS